MTILDWIKGAAFAVALVWFAILLTGVFFVMPFFLILSWTGQL